MRRTILLSCHDAPYYGGAATFMYLLFEYLQKLEYDAHYLTLSNKTKVSRYERNFGSSWWNPAHLDNVHLYVSENFNRREQPKLRDIIGEINPSLIIGKNDIAPRLLKREMSGIETWFLSSSNKKMSNACKRGLVASLAGGIRELSESNETIHLTSSKEQWAVKLSDRIICDSDVTKYCFERFYPRYSHKILKHVFWSAPLLKKKLLSEATEIKDFS